VAVVRLPQVHNTVKQGLVTDAIELARQKGVSAYVGDGRNRWPAVHVLDAARRYRLVLENLEKEKLEKGAKYHAVAEEGVPMRDIAEVIGRGLKVPVISASPEEAPAHFGWLAAFADRDLAASGAFTKKRLGWQPTGPYVSNASTHRVGPQMSILRWLAASGKTHSSRDLEECTPSVWTPRPNNRCNLKKDPSAAVIPGGRKVVWWRAISAPLGSDLRRCM
jgi:hypothetical protein